MTLEYATPPAPKPSKAMIWIGRVISAIPVLMMGVMGTIILLTKPEMINEGMTKYGFPAGVGRPITIVEILCVVIYVIPQTAVLGAMLLTGYLGGAVCIHVHAGEPFFFPIIFGVLVWLGLWFRDARVRALAPIRKL